MTLKNGFGHHITILLLNNEIFNVSQPNFQTIFTMYLESMKIILSLVKKTLDSEI